MTIFQAPLACFSPVSPIQEKKHCIYRSTWKRRDWCADLTFLANGQPVCDTPGRWTPALTLARYEVGDAYVPYVRTYVRSVGDPAK